MERTFTFRLRSSQAAIVVEMLGESGEWTPQIPSLTFPGFRLYLLYLLLCLHHSLVVNARERGLQLQKVEARFEVVPLEWRLQQLRGSFALLLDPAATALADAETLAAIVEQMNQCPVSRNLSGEVAQHITLQLAPIG